MHESRCTREHKYSCITQPHAPLAGPGPGTRVMIKIPTITGTRDQDQDQVFLVTTTTTVNHRGLGPDPQRVPGPTHSSVVDTRS